MSRVTKDQSSSLTLSIVSFHTRLTAQTHFHLTDRSKEKIQEVGEVKKTQWLYKRDTKAFLVARSTPQQWEYNG